MMTEKKIVTDGLMKFFFRLPTICDGMNLCNVCDHAAQSQRKCDTEKKMFLLIVRK